jgi:ankyrin repeat protein/serine/threonine protein kinase
MMEALAASNRRVKWSHLLQYIEAHVKCDNSHDNVKLPFDSPLSTLAIPDDELKAELSYCRQTGDSLLRKAVLGGAPVRLVAALCHLAPEALSVADHKGRFCLHLACLLPPCDRTHDVLTLLVRAHSTALLGRDHGGRTPLHYLCWFHAKQRTPEIVAAFCTKLPKTKFYGLKQHPDGDKKHPLPELPRPQNKIPHTAAILPDAKHGCLPFHYAVANQCSLEILMVLLQVFPLSKHVTDRYGRTALHWYLGAGHHCTHVTHVSGEESNPHEAPWWERPLDGEILQLLSSSRVARTTDWMGRHPLHWAALKTAMALYHETTQFPASALKAIRSHFTGQILGQDFEDQTPLMVFFDAIGACQSADISQGRPIRQVEPNAEAFHLLLLHPDTLQGDRHRPATVEDAAGRLPLHAALEVGSSATVVSQLLAQHPTALVHTSEVYMAPLHAAFTKRAAPLQSAAVAQVLLQTYTAGSQETVVVDGRMSLKLEDAAGSFPIHYAAEHQASLQVLRLLVQAYPPISLQQRQDGNLAIHCLMRPSMIQYLTTPATLTDNNEAPAHSDDEFLTDRQKLQVFFPYVMQDEKALSIKGSISEMLPLQMAVLFQVLDRPDLQRLLMAYPEGAAEFTSQPDYSILDLHERCQSRWLMTTDDWQHVRELLFAFVPNLASHRHRQELLDRCVRIVISEVNEEGDRPHWNTSLDLEEGNQRPLALSHSLSAVEAKTRLELRIRAPPKRSKAKKKEETTRRPKSKVKASSAKSTAIVSARSTETTDTKNQPSSVYDDDNTNLEYDFTSGSFSDGATDDEDDSYFSATDREEGDEDDDSSVGEGEEIVLGESAFTEDEGFQTESGSQLGQSRESPSYMSSYQQSTSFQNTGSFGDGSLTLGSSRAPMVEPAMRWSNTGRHDTLDAFDKAMDENEEKKDDDEEENDLDMVTPLASSKKQSLRNRRPAFLSDVGLRLWTFFAMYSDANNPSDNYVEQVGTIFGEVPFANVEKLVRLHLPSHASHYLNHAVEDNVEVTFRDVANPKCRELIHKTCYFVGKYDFASYGKDVLVHRHPSGRSFTVRAFQWHFTTQESTDAVNPGISEEAIWKVGEIPSEIGLTFRSQKRPVVMKFTNDPDEYHDEVSCRELLGENTVLLPLLSSYNADSTERHEDRSYKTDINDERFNMLDLGRGSTEFLKNFPYALVYAESVSLLDTYRKRGFDSEPERKQVCKDIGDSLVELHSKNIIHGGLSLGKIVYYSEGESSARWQLSDCVGGTLSSGNSFLGRVSQSGHALSAPISAPPELMEKVSPSQLRHYAKYWATVSKFFGVSISKSLTEPYVNPATGESFVFRYFFQPAGRNNDDTQLPRLPYSVLPATTAADMWAFGLVIFELYAGRPLIPYDGRSGAVLDCSLLAKWDTTQAANLIYDCVEDPLAQDLLLLLLGPAEFRLTLAIEDVLKHPMFLPVGTKSGSIDAIVEKRRMDTAAHKRFLQRRLEEASIKDWRTSRSVSLVCWDLSILEKFQMTPSDVVDLLANKKTEISFPCTYLLLPYKLEANEYGVLGPQSVDDFVKIETLGVNLLLLSKACRFASLLRSAMQDAPPQRKWSSADFFSLVDGDDYNDVKKDLASLANKYVESFRDNPMSIAIRLIQERILDVLSLYADDDADFYLYLVDEYRCLPLASSPIVLSASDDRRSEVILCSLLAMQLTVLHAIEKYPGGEGLLNLLNQSGAGHVPPLWHEALVHRSSADTATTGLLECTHELLILQEAFSSLEASHESGGDSHTQRHLLHPHGDLRVLRHLVEDRLANWGDLYRVTVPDEGDRESCLWTHAEVAEGLRKRAGQSSWKSWMNRQRRLSLGSPPASPTKSPTKSRPLASPSSRSSPRTPFFSHDPSSLS